MTAPLSLRFVESVKPEMTLHLLPYQKQYTC